jgi:hypothetical protein
MSFNISATFMATSRTPPASGVLVKVYAAGPTLSTVLIMNVSPRREPIRIRPIWE